MRKHIKPGLTKTGILAVTLADYKCRWSKEHKLYLQQFFNALQ